MNKTKIYFVIALGLSFGFGYQAFAQTPDGYVDGEPVFCADADCGIGNGAAPIEIIVDDVEITTSEGDVIKIGDSSGKMVKIYGGEAGRYVLNELIRLSNDESLSAGKRFVAALMQERLLDIWRARSANN